MLSTAKPVFSPNSQQLELEKCSIPISNSVSLNVYSNTKPHNLKIANLQKGLILVCNGTEKVGEGAGFGFPVLVCPEETYFSGSAIVSLSKTSRATMVRKEFLMDRISRNKLGNTRLENRQARAFIKSLCGLYQKNKRFRFLPLNEFIARMGVETTFRETESAGKIPITYIIRGNTVEIRVDLSQVKRKNQKRIFILNEQSASFFRKYSDSKKTTLFDGQIDAWNEVNCENASLTDFRGQFGFRVYQVAGAVLRRGRETMRNCLDWVGLDYELYPNVEFFEYRIRLLGVK